MKLLHGWLYVQAHTELRVLLNFYLICVYSAVKCGQKNVIFEV